MNLQEFFEQPHAPTKKVFARALGVSRPAVHYWATEKYLPSPQKAQQIEELTGGLVPVEYWDNLALQRSKSRRSK